MATLSAIGGPGNTAAIVAIQHRESQARTFTGTTPDPGSSADTATPSAAVLASGSTAPDAGTAASGQGDSSSQQSTVAFAQLRGEGASAAEDVDADRSTAAQDEATAVDTEETQGDTTVASTDNTSPAAGGTGQAERAPGGAGGGSSVDTTVYDPLDTNQDGVVSEMERLMGDIRNTAPDTADPTETAETEEDAPTRRELAAQATALYVDLSSSTAPSAAGSQLDATA